VNALHIHIPRPSRSRVGILGIVYHELTVLTIDRKELRQIMRPMEDKLGVPKRTEWDKFFQFTRWLVFRVTVFEEVPLMKAHLLSNTNGSLPTLPNLEDVIHLPERTVFATFTEREGRVSRACIPGKLHNESDIHFLVP
jgi:hypothetical protein